MTTFQWMITYWDDKGFHTWGPFDSEEFARSEVAKFQELEVLYDVKLHRSPVLWEEVIT